MNDEKKARLLIAARSVFLRYGYKRVTMNDIAEAAEISRAALYIDFKNKEDIFVSVYLQWVDETDGAIRRALATVATPEKKLERAFEIWAVRPFELTMSSSEANELLECGYEFAQAALKKGYKIFEATIAPVVASIPPRRSGTPVMAPERVAHLLSSAVRGFKQTAATPAELRRLIKQLLALSLA